MEVSVVVEQTEIVQPNAREQAHHSGQIHPRTIVLGIDQILAQRGFGSLVVVLQARQANADKPRQHRATHCCDQGHPEERAFELQPCDGHALGEQPQDRDERHQREYRTHQTQPQILSLAGKAHAVLLNALRSPLHRRVGALPARQINLGQGLTPAKGVMRGQVGF
jgi:hypothetical protein